MKTLSQY